MVDIDTYRCPHRNNFKKPGVPARTCFNNLAMNEKSGNVSLKLVATVAVLRTALVLYNF